MIVKIPGYDEEIVVDELNHTLRLPLRVDKKGRTVYKTYGHYQDVKGALKALVKAKSIKPDKVITLNEYIYELNKHTDRLENILTAHIKEIE